MKLTADTALFLLAGVAILAAIGLSVAGPPGFALFGWVAAPLLGTAALVLRSPRWGTLAGASVALGASLYLYWLKVRSGGGPAICTVNELIDCASINASPYSVLFGDSALETPITLLGTGYFAGLVIASLASPAKAPRLYQVSALFALFNIIVTLYLGSILFIEQKICLFCIAIYVSNLLILWAAFRGMAGSGVSMLDDLGALATARSLWTVAVSFGAIVVAGHLLFPPDIEPPTPDITEPSSPSQASSLAQVDISRYAVDLDRPVELHGAEPTKGATEPAYILVEFADYACPHCREATLEIAQLAEKHPDVQVIFKAFPLDKECNPAFPPEAESRFPQRCVPAYYAECARQQGRFWEVASDIFRNQDMLARSGFPTQDLDILVRNRGVDLQALQDCLRDPETRRMVLLDGRSGAQAGVDGTPAFFLKGTRADGGWVQLTPRRGFADLFVPIAVHRQANASAQPDSPAGEPPSDEPAQPDSPASEPASDEPEP